MIALPRPLAAAVESELRTVDARRLHRLAAGLSDRYRGERVAGERLVSDREAVLAYLAQILPATFAQVSAALRMAPRRAPGFAPRTLLDLGSGPGTAAWAAAELWPSIERVTLVERERAFLAAGRALAQASPRAALREAGWVHAELPRGVPAGPFDLVVLAHVLDEMSGADAERTLHAAWEATQGVLCVVEPGTPRGFASLEASRRALLAAGAHVLAPCPHSAACPLADAPRREPPDWCHFAERSERPAFQRRVKDASLSWEDAKLSHVVVGREPAEHAPWARVLRHPFRGKGHVELVLCSQDGLVRRTVTRSAGEAWRLAKGLAWGSAVERREDLGR